MAHYETYGFLKSRVEDMAKLGRPLAMKVEDRRKEIFNIAEQLFGEKGFENVTMSEIASETGMSKKTLYVYFKDKKELLKDLILSSYIWEESALPEQNLSAIQLLKYRLKVCAEHVLSDRHIKLCRLAISESIGIEGLSDTFYEIGISKSRDHLIEAIQKIEKNHYKIHLSAEILADMLFGASIAKPFIDTLMVGEKINFDEIFIKIEQTLDALFVSSSTNLAG